MKRRDARNVGEGVSASKYANQEKKNKRDKEQDLIGQTGGDIHIQIFVIWRPRNLTLLGYLPDIDLKVQNIQCL
jgi:hypothetical protein